MNVFVQIQPDVFEPILHPLIYGYIKLLLENNPNDNQVEQFEIDVHTSLNFIYEKVINYQKLSYTEFLCIIFQKFKDSNFKTQLINDLLYLHKSKNLQEEVKTKEK